MGNCAKAKPGSREQRSSKYQIGHNKPLTKKMQVKSKSGPAANAELFTPMGPDVADMAYRQDEEFEMLHRLKVMFRS